LSEVTGNKPSSIAGTLEVFGDKADLLIAYTDSARMRPIDIGEDGYLRAQDIYVDTTGANRGAGAAPPRVKP
jgi:hypothetical protein